MATKDLLASAGQEVQQPSRDTPSVTHMAASGAVWAFLAFAVSKVLGFGTNLILARVLSPSDFGLVSFAMVVVGAITLLQDLGVPAAIIYGNRDVKLVGGTALTINVGAAILLFGLTILASPFIAEVAGHDEIASMLVVLAIALVVQALGSVQSALLVRELAFRRKFLPDVLPLVASNTAAVGMALLGFGAWSLVLAHLIKTLLTTALLWHLSDIRPTPEFRRPIARDLLLYGKHISFSSIIGFLALNVDYLIVGHVLGSFALGIYTMAFTIANLPYSTIGQSVVKVSFPAYSRLRDNESGFHNIFTDTIHAVSLLTIPVGIAIFTCATSLPDVIIGNKWLSIIDPLRILVTFGVVRCISSTFGSAYRALGHPEIEWHFTLLKLVIMTPLMLLLTPYGVQWAAYVHIITTIPMLPLHVITLSRLLHVSPIKLCSTICSHVAGVTVASLVLFSIHNSSLSTFVHNNLVYSIFSAIIAIASYLLVALMTNRRVGIIMGNTAMLLAVRR